MRQSVSTESVVPNLHRLNYQPRDITSPLRVKHSTRDQRGEEESRLVETNMTLCAVNRILRVTPSHAETRVAILMICAKKLIFS